MKTGSVARQIWIDGALVPWRDATVHVLSHSHQRGSLVFDFLSVHRTPKGDAVFRLADHVDRFLTSCQLVGLPLSQDAAAVATAVLAAVRANPGATVAKVCAYLPSVEIDVVPLDEHVALAVAAFDPVTDVVEPKGLKSAFRPQVRLFVEKQSRNRRADIISPHAKVAANYVSPMVAKWKARKAGYDEIVLLDEDDGLAEGPTTNLFLVDPEGRLCTPPQDRVLLGVTRRSILELAKDEGILVRENPLQLDDLDRAAEVFLTGTSAGIWPVESVDGKRVGDGVPGPVTRALSDRFRRITRGEDSAFAHWLTPVGAGEA